MTLVWRLVPPEYASRLDGKGNVEPGARWNSPGRGVVYSSINLSLCVLETLANLPMILKSTLPEMAAVQINIPDLPSRNVERSQLPSESAGEDLVRWCRKIGDAWLAAEEELMLTAPSFVVPQERNV